MALLRTVAVGYAVKHHCDKKNEKQNQYNQTQSCQQQPMPSSGLPMGGGLPLAGGMSRFERRWDRRFGSPDAHSQQPIVVNNHMSSPQPYQQGPYQPPYQQSYPQQGSYQQGPYQQPYQQQHDPDYGQPYQGQPMMSGGDFNDPQERNMCRDRSYDVRSPPAYQEKEKH